MKDYNFDILICAVAFIIFFAMIFGFAAYSDTQRAECRKAAIEKNMTATEIQAICK
jgi:predicted negative regulator of RcsB-dependent stress response